MAFDLLAFLQRFFGGLNVTGIEERVITWIWEKGAEYPDLAARTEALAHFITTTLAEIAPALDPATMRDTIFGIASDIVRGTAGVDPSSWQGGA